MNSIFYFPIISVSWFDIIGNASDLIIKLAKDGKLKPTAGGGIGMERLVGWLAGVNHIAECQPFPRVPGNVNEL